MNFYKSVIEHHGKLLVRGIHDGQEFKEKIDYSPTLYAISQQDTEFKTLTGQSLKPIQFGSIKKARDFKRITIQIVHLSLVWIVININTLQTIILKK
jgi:hypothetical protein